jgi:glutamate/tyrosine decarboxylase-like PLP-dependent enzyme
VTGPVLFNERGPELSRGFKALKVWMGLLRHGRQGYAAVIEHDVAMARFLAGEIRDREEFELLAEPGLSIVNFRLRPRGCLEDRLDRLNRQVANRLVAKGEFFLAPTLIRGRTSLRVAVVNFRTREEDLRALLEATAREGRDLLGAG